MFIPGANKPKVAQFNPSCTNSKMEQCFLGNIGKCSCVSRQYLGQCSYKNTIHEFYFVPNRIPGVQVWVGDFIDM